METAVICWRHITSVLVACALVGCSSGPTTPGGIPIDQVPMYGGMDRSAYPELKAGDEKLIQDASTAFGSREKASTAWVDQGFRFYQRDDLAMAMRRFNQ